MAAAEVEILSLRLPCDVPDHEALVGLTRWKDRENAWDDRAFGIDLHRAECIVEAKFSGTKDRDHRGCSHGAQRPSRRGYRSSQRRDDEWISRWGRQHCWGSKLGPTCPMDSR